MTCIYETKLHTVDEENITQRAAQNSSKFKETENPYSHMLHIEYSNKAEILGYYIPEPFNRASKTPKMRLLAVKSPCPHKHYTK